jgi:mannose-6-phosphate isomerase-like protein (cupin superfamily)
MEKYERFQEWITDTMPMAKLDPDAPQTEVTCLRGTWSHGDAAAAREGMAALENFPAGKTTHWIFWYDEVHYILDGKATMRYTLPGNRFTEEKEVVVEKGHVYIIPRGADIYWDVDPSGPLKKFCVVMPAPERYMPGSIRSPDGSILK